jgi:cold shock protein
VADRSTMKQALGKVKWFNDVKGYGFIAREDDSDVFVHHTAIQMQGYRTLKEGEVVEYELLDGDKGPQAVNVMKEPKEAQS